MKTKLLASLACVIWLIQSPAALWATDYKTPFPGPTVKSSSIIIKTNIVKIAPNPTSNGIISVSSMIDDDVHFFVFDSQANLLQNIVLKRKAKPTILNLKKGVYTYDVFKNEEGIEQGTITVK